MLIKNLLLSLAKIGAPYCSVCGKKLVDYNKQYRYLGNKKDPLRKFHTPYGDGYVFLCINPNCCNRDRAVVREHPWKSQLLFHILHKFNKLSRR